MTSSRPAIGAGGWVAGGLSLALAVLIPPFILFVPISFALAADGAVLGRQTHPSRGEWIFAAGLLFGPLGLRAARRARPGGGS